MQIDRPKSAYELGYAAGKAGKAMWACPYIPSQHQQDYRDWERGWANGFRDRRLTGGLGSWKIL
jgi:ribosome modulation factor